MKNAMVYESELNIGLSDLLRDKGLASSPEKQIGKKRHDIDIKVGLLTAVIEAEKGQSSSSKNRAVNEASGRITDKTADIALALCYPEGTERENLKEQKFEWTIRSPRTLNSPPEWVLGGLDDLATVILQLPNELGDPDTLAERLSNALETAVACLPDGAKEALAEVLDLPAEGKNLNTATMRALLVVATAIMFHARLDEHLEKPTSRPALDRRKTPPSSFQDEWPPMSAIDCASADSPVFAYSKAWNVILALDYRPIFETARKALNSAPPSPGMTRTVSRLADMVLGIAGQAASLRHDLLGRIFHRILDSARYDGSYYTSTTSASLLASLALRDGDADWNSAESIGRLRVIDPACGTGTLLMAVAERVRDLVNREGGMDGLEKTLIEDVLHGYDTNLTATHLAATTLGLLSPGTEFAKMNIERTFLGVNNGHASLGSLEFVSGGQPSLLGWPTSSREHIDSPNPPSTETPEFDIVIMNPPFTRDSLRHNQFSRQDKTILNEREKLLLIEHIASGTLHMSSQGNNFVVLADRLTRAGGTMAAVLPMVTATNPSSRGIRRFIADKFHVETVVISHDPQRQSFSENTDISELLLVCRKHESSDKPPTQVFSLTVNPATPAEAMMTANAIITGEVKGSIVKHEINSDSMAVGDWSAVQFLSPRLAALFSKLRMGDFFAVKQLMETGDTLTGQAVRGVFDRRAHAQQHGMIALWNHKTGAMTTMSAKHDTYIAAKPDMERQALGLWKRRGRLMFPARLWLPLTRTPTVLLSRFAVGSAWCPFNFTITDNKRQIKTWEKALCLYLNSSIGILALLGIKDFKKMSYPNFSKDSIGKLPIPDLVNLPPKQATAMATAFDRYANDELQPLRDMALCDVRREIDYAVADALGIKHEDMNELRELLPREPSISGRRYETLA